MNYKIKQLTFVIALSISTPILASGIPVVDVAGIAQMLQSATQQAAQALDQLNATKNAMMAEKARFEGNWSLADVLNDPTLISYLPSKDWQDLYTSGRDFTQLRKKYNLVSNNPIKQKAFDGMLANLDVMEKSYESTVKRQKNIEDLSRYMNSAQTPQQKSDFSNRLAFEQVQLANEKSRLDSLNVLMKQKKDLESEAKANAFKNKMLGK